MTLKSAIELTQSRKGAETQRFQLSPSQRRARLAQFVRIGDRTVERDELAAQFARRYEAFKGDRLHAGDRA